MAKEKNKFDRPAFDASKPPKLGVLLMNLGTPDAPEPTAIKRYLSQFLHDWRVIETKRSLWCPILHFFILPTRPHKIAPLYAKVWTKEGSPLLVIGQKQAAAVEQKLNANRQSDQLPITVALGMRYGNPSVASAMAELCQQNAQKILILPLYPQYSCATTASSFDAVFSELKKWRWMPEIRTVRDYYWHPKYIEALANSVRIAWQNHAKPKKLVLSFHGTPERFRDLGDPYYDQCQQTANALALCLKLEQDDWILTFQSRFGKDPWLKPATDNTLQRLAREGIESVDVICPGFSADCIETLEEIEEENREAFESCGGKIFHYIEALNDQQDHIECLSDLIKHHIVKW